MSGPLWAAAFDSLDAVEVWATKSELSPATTTELADSWRRASTALTHWLQGSKRSGSALPHDLRHTPVAPTASILVPPLTARSQEDSRLSRSLDKMVQFAWRMHQCSQLMHELKRDIISHAEIDRLLRLACRGYSASPSTWSSTVRAAERLENWLTDMGLSCSQVTGIRLAQHLADLQAMGASLPVAALTALSAVSHLLVLQWPVEHPLVLGIAKDATRSKSQSQGGSQQAAMPCLSIEQLKHLEQVTCETEVPLAVRWAAAVACLLAHVCLRFSDAQRSEGIRTNGI